MDRPLLLKALVAVALLSLPWAPARGGDPSANAILHFTDSAGLAEDCAATRAVERSLDIEADAPLEARLDAALRALFAGVSAEERVAGLSDPYDRLFMEPEPLPAYYLGVRVVEGVAVVDFAEPGLSYLNSEACRQAVIKTPIVRTLLAFAEIGRVAFAIGGEIVTEWGA
jgi:hypothetical protein